MKSAHFSKNVVYVPAVQLLLKINVLECFCESDARLWCHLYGKANRNLHLNALIELKTS